MKLKRRIFLTIPRSFQKEVKDFYYGKLIDGYYRFKHLLDYGKLDFFETIAIETTTYCNLRCSFCPNSKYERGLQKNEKKMDEKIFKKIINELSRFNFSGRVALYSYGEPCTDDRLPDLVRYAREKLPKANIEINSNGFLLTLNLYKKLVDSGISCIYVSQYGKSMPKTIKEIFEYLKTRPKGENKISYRIFNEELYPLISNRGGEIEVAENVNYERPICGYPNHAQTIDYQGNWVLCCNDYHSSIKFGNLEKESILQVWNKPYFKKIRKETNNGVYNLEICKKCVGIVKPKKENLVSISN